MSRIISFRGLLAGGLQEKISLQTKSGEKGYRIKRMELLGSDLTGRDQESVFKVYTLEQSSIDGAVDFSDTTLLAAGFYEQVASTSYFGDQIVVFDNVKFNQNIFLTHDEAKGSHPINYHLELEITDLSLDEATVTTLKNIRNAA